MDFMPQREYGIIVDGYYYGLKPSPQMSTSETISYYINDYKDFINDKNNEYCMDFFGNVTNNKASKRSIYILGLLINTYYLPCEIVLPNGIYVSYGCYFQLFIMIILILSFIITCKIHKKRAFETKDWIG